MPTGEIYTLNPYSESYMNPCSSFYWGRYPLLNHEMGSFARTMGLTKIKRMLPSAYTTSFQAFFHQSIIVYKFTVLLPSFKKKRRFSVVINDNNVITTAFRWFSSYPTLSLPNIAYQERRRDWARRCLSNPEWQGANSQLNPHYGLWRR